MSKISKRYAIIALLVLGSATLLFSCSDKPAKTTYDLETLMTESSEHRTITMMEGGRRSYIFSAPLIEGYSMAKNPYQEFRRGIDMTTFTTDTVSLINATISANYAIYYEKQQLWEAKGNVIIHKYNREEGDTVLQSVTDIYTQQLFWNAKTKKIYSNVDTKVVQQDGIHFGVGFDADEALTNIHFRKYSSEVEYDLSQQKQRDSLATEEVEAKGANEAPKSKPSEAPKPPTEGSIFKPNTPKVLDNNKNIDLNIERPSLSVDMLEL